MGKRWTLEKAGAEPGPGLHPLAGARFSVFANRSLFTAGLHPRNRKQRFIGWAAQCARFPFALYESIKWGGAIRREKLDKPPVFLVGHWRSGTTHLHNLMSRDPQFGYMTFAETAMPLDMLGKKVELGRKIIDDSLPETRGYDNVKLTLSEPQEEEMALGNLNSVGYYNIYYFPQQMEKEQKKALLLEGATEKEKQKFEETYEFLVRKVSYVKGGRQLLFKNPSSAARIPMLKRLFPDAKFVYIVRNPWPVFCSSVAKFPRLMNAFAWQDWDGIDFADFTLRNYGTLQEKYLADREELGLPESDLVETSYEKITADPVGEIGRIYDKLGIENKEEGLKPIAEYANSISSYKRNVHTVSHEHAGRIQNEWKFAFDEWGYDLEPPADIKVR
ncbi:MAG: sulfotransferase [Verrucomicrobiales bacterium]|nr:sulfotransferase [Verrucomicrobiales bacterium]